MKNKEMKMREKHPALQELWSKYKTLYTLLDDGTCEDDIPPNTAADLISKLRKRAR